MASNSGRGGGAPIRLILGILLLVPALILGYTTLVRPTLGIREMSYQDIRITGEPKDVGEANYVRLAEDARYQAAVSFTSSLVERRVIVVAVLPLLIALALNEFGRLVRIPVRLLLSVPLGLAVPAGFYVAWSMALNPQFGLFAGTNFLGNPDLAPAALRDIDSFFSLIVGVGVGVIVYLMALRGTGDRAPRGLRVILPALAVWLLSILAAAALALHTFSMPYIMTAGGPASVTTTTGLYLYQVGFQRFQMGYAAAIAWNMLVTLGALGLAAGVIVVLSGLRLEVVPGGKPFGFLKGNTKIIALIVLAAALIGTGWGLWNAIRPVIWSWQIGQGAIDSPFPGPQGDKPPTDAAREVIDVDQVVVNTRDSAISGALFVQLGVTVLAAFAIGAVRPLGRFSEALLLLFSPWLFVGALPLTLRLFLDLRDAQMIDTLNALATPFLVNVPILFVLTLFFRGQARKWRLRGNNDAVGFLTGVVLPSVPLVVLLGLVTAALHASDVVWPLLAIRSPDLHTVSLSLLFMRGAMTTDFTTIAGALAIFSVPAFLLSMGGLAIFQIFYFDRLAIGASIIDRG